MAELLEHILSSGNMLVALNKVKANKGAGGVDGISTEEIDQYLKDNWVEIKDKIRQRKYKPKPVRRVEIPKPNGGVRNLGIPTIVDRVIEQAIAQVLTPIAEPHFSDNSYGFRPNRRAQQAIVKLLEYFNDGNIYVVDIDLEKFFDNVPQDKLMTLIHNLINELDKELEVRYADDCIIAVGSNALANRVMASVTKWIEKKLRLKVNATKSKVTNPRKLKYLGYGFWKDKTEWKARPHEDSVKRFQRKLKQLTKRSWVIPMTYRINKLNQVIRGWINYFRLGNMKYALKRIDEHLRRRMRIIIWKQWKKREKIMWGLRKLGTPMWMAKQSAGFGGHY